MNRAMKGTTASARAAHSLGFVLCHSVPDSATTPGGKTLGGLAGGP